MSAPNTMNGMVIPEGIRKKQTKRPTPAGKGKKVVEEEKVVELEED